MVQLHILYGHRTINDRKPVKKTISPNKQVFKIKDLHPAEYNPRTIKPKALTGLSNSLNKFGYLQHIVVNIRDGRNRVISGHQRLKVLSDTAEEVECIIVNFDDITEKAANISFNSESISGDWELEALEGILQDLHIELPEFEDLELDSLADGLDIDLDSLDSDINHEDNTKSDSESMITCPHCGEKFEK